MFYQVQTQIASKLLEQSTWKYATNWTTELEFFGELNTTIPWGAKQNNLKGIKLGYFLLAPLY